MGELGRIKLVSVSPGTCNQCPARTPQPHCKACHQWYKRLSRTTRYEIRCLYLNVASLKAQRSPIPPLLEDRGEGV